MTKSKTVKKAFFALVALALLWLTAFAFLFFMQGSMIFAVPSKSKYIEEVHNFQKVEVEASDGVSLQMLLHPAKSDEPYVILFHGNGGDLYQMLPTANQYVAAGFGVMIAEYRGYSGNLGVPSMEGLYSDGIAAFEKLRALSSAPIFLHGHSLGAAIVVHVAQKKQSAGIALLSPFDSLLAVAQARYPIFPVKSALKHDFPSIEKIPEIKAQIMIVHGALDKVIPIHHGQTLYQAAPEGSLFLKIDEANHNDLEKFGATQEVIEFFQSIR